MGRATAAYFAQFSPARPRRRAAYLPEVSCALGRRGGGGSAFGWTVGGIRRLEAQLVEELGGLAATGLLFGGSDLNRVALSRASLMAANNAKRESGENERPGDPGSPRRTMAW